MKYPLFSSRRALPSRHGMALITVLILIALITAVVVGFIVASGMEMTSSRYYSASSNARLMADTAINLVQGQINQATSQGTAFSWASQPGAIRVYKNDGTLDDIFKLYSAQNLTTADVTTMDTASTAPGTNDMPPSTWANSPAVWVDLNAPVSDSLSNLHYPIFNSTNALNVDGCTTTSPPGPTTTAPVPMPVIWLYVLQNGTIVAPDAGGGTQVTFNNSAVSPSSSNPIMGRIAYWTDDETCKVNINTAGGDGYFGENGAAAGDPTPIANANFWDTPHYNSPDDEGAGYNTTGTPYGLAGSQPVAGEFQRYPGHPAAVALNNVLNGLGWTLPSSSFYNVLTVTSTGVSVTPGITPRYAYGGSEGGTAFTIGHGNNSQGAIQNVSSFLPLVPNPQNRLYSSVAEMLFQPYQSPQTTRAPSAINKDNAATRQQIETSRFFLTAHSEAPEVNLFGEPRVSMWPVWTLNPSVIINNSVSGVGNYTAAAQRTTIDNLLCFASTVNGNGPAATQYPYYFVRGDPTSSTTDIGYVRNQTLLSYLDTLTSTDIPGFGSNFQSNDKYGQPGMRQILTEIFDYIRTINEADTSQPLVNGNNAYEYDHEWGVGTGGSSENNDNGWYQVAPTVITSTSAPKLGWGGTYQGFGAYPRLNEVAIQFVAVGQGALSAGLPTPGQPSTNYVNQAYKAYIHASPTPPSLPFAAGDSGADPNGTATPQNTVVRVTTPASVKGNFAAPGNTVAIQAFILLDFTNPSQMFMNDGVNAGQINPFLWAEISGLNPSPNPNNYFTVKTTASPASGYSLQFDPNAAVNPNDDATLMWGNMSGGGVNNNWDCINFAMGIAGRTISPGILNGETTSAAYYSSPFYSAILPLAIPAASTNGTGLFQFTGGPLTIKLYDGGVNGPPGQGNANVGKAQLVQTYTLNFGYYNAGSASSYTTTLPLPVVNGTSPTFGMGGGTDRWAGVSNAGNDNSYYIVPGDVVQSMVLSPQWSDARVLASTTVPSSAFIQHPVWSNNQTFVPAGITLAQAYTGAFAYSLFAKEAPWYSAASGPTVFPAISPTSYIPPHTPGVLNPNTTTTASTSTTISGFQPYVPPELTGGTTGGLLVNFPNPVLMDWDTGIGCLPDGPWINKVDEGNVTTQNGAQIPYYQDTGTALNSSPSLFSPNHEVPSPGMFGSLSTGVDPNGVNPTPWRTLLFRPSPGTSKTYLGGASPEDELLLDLFWMPVEEPYAISEPFTSAGKINLNYQIEPFTYITRSTAIRAVLNSEKIASVNVSSGSTYKAYNAPQMKQNARYALNIPVTLAQFDDKFNGTDNSGVNSSTTPDIFHSAAQICDMYLVPIDSPDGPYTSAATFATKWYDGKTYGLVGDNVRERPYANIYGQITTKSNSYTVYYTVQSLKNAEPAALQTQWDETKGSVVGEYRGSTTIERYIDPNQILPDFAAAGNAGVLTVDGNLAATPPQPSDYNWRIVDNHQFAP